MQHVRRRFIVITVTCNIIYFEELSLRDFSLSSLRDPDFISILPPVGSAEQTASDGRLSMRKEMISFFFLSKAFLTPAEFVGELASLFGIVSIQPRKNVRYTSARNAFEISRMMIYT